MSLLREIYDFASGDGDVTTTLRKCKILAARLRSDEFAHWVDWELNGYPEEQPTPEYRCLHITYYASFMGHWKVPKSPLPAQIVPKEHRDSFRYKEFRDGIAKAASFTGEGTAALTHRPDLISFVEGKIFPDLSCYHVWSEISGVEFRQLVSAVKNRIVDFALKIEAENPDAGEAAPNSQPVPIEKLRPLVLNTFYGPVGNVAQNSEHFNQTTNSGVAEDLQKFVTDFADHLHELDLDTKQQRKAKAQIDTIKAQIADEPDPVIITQAGRTLRSITEGAIGSLIATAAQPAVWEWIRNILVLFK